MVKKQRQEWEAERLEAALNDEEGQVSGILLHRDEFESLDTLCDPCDTSWQCASDMELDPQCDTSWQCASDMELVP
jgi:hypothetical protein